MDKLIERIEVTQADRDAAAEEILCRALPRTLASEVSAGKRDDHHTVQAFARHRAAAVNALPTLLDELERLQKGLAKIAEMTDVEADFADGFELRAIARTALQGAADV